MKKDNPQFDIYPDLDRHIGATVGQTGDEAMTNAVGERVAMAADQEPFSEDVREWIVEELVAAQATWATKYRTLFAKVPSFIELAGGNPNFGQTVERLYKAKRKLSLPTLKIEADQNETAGESMSLVMIPWQAFRERLEDTHFADWLEELRKSQGLEEDVFNDELLAAIVLNRRLYQDPAFPSEWISSQDYLDQKIEQDGPWGFMLMQGSMSPGFVNAPLPTTTEEAVMVGDVQVDAMGVFEWLALSLQSENAGDMLPGWLPASYIFDANNDQMMAVGTGGMDHISTWLLTTKGGSLKSHDIRLAVA